jgi:hypothetical protein
MLIPCRLLEEGPCFKSFAADLGQFASVADGSPCKENYLRDVFAMMKHYILALVKESGLGTINISFQDTNTGDESLIMDVKW